MPDEHPQQTAQTDADLEREILEGRKFSLAEAIGRLAGPGMMKGISPATRQQQAEAELTTFLDRQVNSPGGALAAVLLRRVKESDLLLQDLDHPLRALQRCVEQILGAEGLLQELVREADQEWGRVYGERPYFQKPGAAPDPEDPYTADSVTATLARLLDVLKV